jgi:23S rRNA (uracil1939-C5)-methyltransferase
MRKKPSPIVFSKIKVTDAGAKGKSIGKSPDGRIIILNDAVPGDIIDVQVNKKRKSYYEGKVLRIIKDSSFRIEPKCTHFQTCGGCSWQNMTYEKQLEYKEKEVIANLERIGNIKPTRILPIIGSKKDYYYRNKLEFSFSNSKWLTRSEIESNQVIENKNALGFHVPGMWNKVVDIDKCWLQKNPSNRIRNFIKTNSIKIQFYRRSKKITILLDKLINEFPKITSLLYVINKKANDTIYDQKIHCYYGRDHIYEKILNFKFKIDPKSFYQTNSNQTKELYKIVKNFAKIKSNEVVYDLYSGIGTISIFIANQAKKVIGIETVNEAVLAAKENLTLNSIKNVSFFTGEIKNVLNNNFVKENGMPDTVIIDPPRSGMHKKALTNLLDIGPKKIIYVSCNSATQARDLGLFKDFYEIVCSQSIDMFPQTYHVENVVLLEKR